VEHFYVKFSDPSCIGFGDIVWKTDRQTIDGKNTSTATAFAWVKTRLLELHVSAHCTTD